MVKWPSTARDGLRRGADPHREASILGVLISEKLHEIKEIVLLEGNGAPSHRFATNR